MAPGADEREHAVLAVLAGAPVAEVAATAGLRPEAVESDVAAFVTAGRERLAGGHDALADEQHRRLALTAHELLTPITIIRGWTKTLGRPGIAPEALVTATRAMDESAARLERLARDLLDSVAVALGRLRLVVGPVDLRAVAERTADSMGGGRVEVVAGPAPVVLVADEQRLDQVLANLVGNALAHGDAGPVWVEVAEDGAHAVVTVRNEGSPPAAVGELFDAFVRSSASRGSGLGLAVTKTLVEAHGGSVEVGADGRTTSFEVRLPLAGPPRGPLVVDRAPPPGT